MSFFSLCDPIAPPNITGYYHLLLVVLQTLLLKTPHTEL